MIDDNDWEHLSQFRLLDREGRVVRWPAKAPQRQLVLRYLLDRFAPGHNYTETEVNDVLKRWHTFGDWALLRRELVDRGHLARDAAGHSYHVAMGEPPEDGPSG